VLFPGKSDHLRIDLLEVCIGGYCIIQRRLAGCTVSSPKVFRETLTSWSYPLMNCSISSTLHR